MRRAGTVVLLVALGPLVACSTDTSSRFRNSGAGGDSSSSSSSSGTLMTTGGILQGTSSTTTGLPGKDGGGTGTGGAGGGGVVVDPVPDPCMTNADCAGDAGSMFICTVSNRCGKISGPCAKQEDCMGDQYCCSGPSCRKDSLPDGVCIPGYVPPGNTECKGTAKVGVFAPAVQCEWPDRVMVGGMPTKPTITDFPAHIQVMSTPTVANTPIDSGAAAEIVFVAGNQTSGEVLGNNATNFGVIRILSGQTCELKATIADPANPLRQTASPALADLDKDGFIDIVARRNDQGLVAFRWDDAQKKYVTYWSVKTDAVHATDSVSEQVWDGPAIHDINNDGIPDVILRTAVYNGTDGRLITNGPSQNGTAIWSKPFNGLIPVLGDIDQDGRVELLTAQQFSAMGVSHWLGTDWSVPHEGEKEFFGSFASHFAYADFGKLTGTTFDSHTLDGKAEIVAVTSEGMQTAGMAANGRVAIYSQDETGTWKAVMNVVTLWDTRPDNQVLTDKYEGGGPPTIGDFDGDGFPEVAIAGGTRFRVFDFDCQNGGNGCESPFVRWSKPSQDGSSKQTGGSAFDFDGDGQVEVVYADECFLRVYDGKTGAVKYSAFRSSSTWYENPVIADVNNDQTTKILVNSAETGLQCSANTPRGTAYIDPIHAGVPCLTAEDCPDMSMTCDNSYCRCTTSAQCRDPGLVCAPPPAGTPGTGNTCRAQHPNGSTANGANPVQHGIRVLNDRLNRWASSRPMWNQHAYSVTNINNDGSIPKTSDWLAQQNFKVKGLNNYRQNIQGSTGVDALPDITGKLDTEACQVMNGQLVLTVNVCNRGKRAVPAAVPVTFYDANGAVLCTGLTNGPVPTGTGCKPVTCLATGTAAATLIGKQVSVKVNDDGKGQRGTVECNYLNNGDSITVTACKGPQ